MNRSMIKEIENRKKRNRRIGRAGAILLLLLLVFICTACSGRSSSAPEISVPEAKRLLIYCSHKPEVYEPIVREFENRTGIWVELKQGGTNELMDRIREGGGEKPDLLFGGGVESYEVNEDLFEVYEPKDAETLKAAYQPKGQVWTAFTELPIVFIYNKKLYSSTQIPQGWGEMLSGRWRGKIAFADPEKSASSCTMLATMMQVLAREERPGEVLRSFAAVLNGKVESSSGEVLDLVSAGNYPVGITLEETARKYIDRGADIGIVFPEEGSSAVPDACGIIKGAKHPENAERFVDFILSRDVQKLAEEKLYRRSVRRDIKRQESGEEKIISYDLEWAVANQEEILKKFREYLEAVG